LRRACVSNRVGEATLATTVVSTYSTGGEFGVALSGNGGGEGQRKENGGDLHLDGILKRVGYRRTVMDG